MASTINADNGVVSGSSGVKTTADTSGVLALQSNGSTGVTLDTSLNVGIGVTTPASRLHLRGSSSTYTGGLVAQDSTSNYFTFYANGNNGVIGTAGTISFASFDGSSQRMLLDTSGNLGLGVTPSIYWGGNKGLDVGSVGCGLTSRQNNEINLGQNAAYNIYATNGVASRFTLGNDGAFYWSQAPSGTTGNAISFTLALSLERDKSLALKGAVSQSGTGITFPATQSASADANTLDDYEEGTWTPTVIGTTVAGTASYSVQTGVYTKIGQLVSFACRVDYSGGTGSGNLRISGLPFTSANNIQRPIAVEVGDISLGAGTYCVASVVNNNTQVSFASCPTGGAAAPSTTYDGSGYILLNGTYYV